MIGYLSVKRVDEKYIGGLLIVDESGIPYEFKYTDPVVPTPLQKILYGKSLEGYLNIEVIAKSLIKRAENRPEVIFTDTPILTDASENVFLAMPAVSNAGQIEQPAPDECIIPYGSGAVRISSSNQISKEKVERLKQLVEEMDILEPFQRLQKALEYICRSSSS
ncbi:MAG TPA: hypothetical protein PLP64_08140 [Pseudothermotoga sp.]|nr:hypothetical protein [Pseudothermotoga sp.]HOK84180.1 hypothetical protein [Pseudothermotoga sp.]HPP69179.1 hypothetical protein [Pseudothermotoga sp.]